MDRELEVCGRGGVSEQEVLSRLVGASRNAVIRIRGYAVEKVKLHPPNFLTPHLTHPRRPSQRSLPSFFALLITPAVGLEDLQISARVTPRYILTSVLAANAIGMLCARSLHYQFYSWLAWGTPYVLWRSGFGPVWTGGLWAAQEWAWNIFPSTNGSSGTVVASLAVAVVGVWWGSGKEVERELALEEDGDSDDEKRK